MQKKNISISLINRNKERLSYLKLDTNSEKIVNSNLEVKISVKKIFMRKNQINKKIKTIIKFW